MSNLTLLTRDQCFFESYKLDVLEKRGTKAALTDFSILSGGYFSKFHSDIDDSLDSITGFYWTKSDDGFGNPCVVDEKGYETARSIDKATGGGRPVIPLLSISKILRRKFEKSKRWNS